MPPCTRSKQWSRRPSAWRTVCQFPIIFYVWLIYYLRRYINTDYVFASSITKDLDAGISRLLVTYDIACQWGVNLQRRLSAYLPPLNLDLTKLTSHRVAVPKFHLVGHGASCQVSYNLALMDNVGLTHGEGVETVWSHSTSLATWSRENGPAARHQVLDDHWGGWNWRKVVNSRTLYSAFTRCAEYSYDYRYKPS